jgi:hypothetical protein
MRAAPITVCMLAPEIPTGPFPAIAYTRLPRVLQRPEVPITEFTFPILQEIISLLPITISVEVQPVAEVLHGLLQDLMQTGL